MRSLGLPIARIALTHAHGDHVGGLDVVEERRADMHVTRARRVRAREELVPVLVRRLVRRDLLRDDDLVERHADVHLRRGDEVGVGVREDRELPTAGAQLVERRANLGERAPARQ